MEAADHKIAHRGPSEPSASTIDAEKEAQQEKDDEKRFDLRDYLYPACRNETQGRVEQHVGVVCEDLQVVVMGGLDHKRCVKVDHIASRRKRARSDE
ncbi:hypothetical protein Hypma_015916 [Hypsizygus marmoreus]|uniref:Uncharacterized protein n=1 Tax=Hypsizygus marmoreus TaxID=39966 RepID=A0A369K4G5_HYPMA|nr:hypothetical protein Hypma_015916 [Hypsizygus marmoreus]